MDVVLYTVTTGANALLGYVITKTPQEQLVHDLKAASVPTSEDPCRTCQDPCDVGHLEYPPRFDIDTATNMLGSVKPYMRQVVISTGKADWPREVTDESRSLANLLSYVSSSSSVPNQEVTYYPPSKPSTRIAILNGSHKSHEDDSHRVIVLPDYKVVEHIPASKQGAESLYKRALDASLTRIGATTSQSSEEESSILSYPLPYACVIMICSHKRRDNRCHVTAPKLETSFCRALEDEGWIVDHDLRDEDCLGSPLEQLEGTDEEKDKMMEERLHDAAQGRQHDQKMALILKISHIGGHKYAGNVIIYTPQGPHTGTGIWYGRVSPHEVPAIVQHTILEGKILPELLRGGINMNREAGKSILDW